MSKLIPAIEKKDWTSKMRKVYDWILEWDYCDEEMAAYTVGGGSYEYGNGIEEVDPDEYDSDEDYREYVDSQRDNWLQDLDLPGSHWWLFGGMI